MAAPPAPLPPTSENVAPTQTQITSIASPTSSPTSETIGLPSTTAIPSTSSPATPSETRSSDEETTSQPNEEFTSTTTIFRPTRSGTSRTSIEARPTRGASSGGGDSGLSSGAIAAIAVCSVIAVLILIALLYFCHRRKKTEARSRRDRKLYEAQMREHQGSAVPVWREQSPITPVPSHRNVDYPMQEPERKPRRHRHRRAPPSLSGQNSPIDLPPALRPSMPYQTTAEAIPYGPILNRRA